MRTRKVFHLWLVLTVAASWMFPASIVNAATDPAGLTIELNKLAQKGSACRITLLIKNDFKAPIEQLDFELALFGPDKRLMKRIAVAAGPYPKGKTRIRQFDLTDISCTAVARLLLNTITTCKGAGLTPQSCLAHTHTRSTASVPLLY